MEAETMKRIAALILTVALLLSAAPALASRNVDIRTYKLLQSAIDDIETGTTVTFDTYLDGDPYTSGDRRVVCLYASLPGQPYHVIYVYVTDDMLDDFAYDDPITVTGVLDNRGSTGKAIYLDATRGSIIPGDFDHETFDLSAMPLSDIIPLARRGDTVIIPAAAITETEERKSMGRMHYTSRIKQGRYDLSFTTDEKIYYKGDTITGMATVSDVSGTRLYLTDIVFDIVP